MLFRLFAGACALALLVTASTVSLAQEKKDPKDKPAFTTWERESGGINLKLEVGKDTLKLYVFKDEDGVTMTCKMNVGKDGVVKATVTDVVEKGKFPIVPKKGFEFSFKWKEKGDAAELTDLKGEGLDDVKAIVEGDYKKKIDKKKD